MIPKSLNKSPNSIARKQNSSDLTLTYVSSLIFSEVPPHSLGTNHPELLKELWHLTHPSFHICYCLRLKCFPTFFAPVIFLPIQILSIKHHLFLSCLPIPSYFVSPMSSHSTLCVIITYLLVFLSYLVVKFPNIRKITSILMSPHTKSSFYLSKISVILNIYHFPSYVFVLSMSAILTSIFPSILDDQKRS